MSSSLPGQLLSVSLGEPWEGLLLLSEELCQWLFCLHLPQKAKGQDEAKQDLVSLAVITLPPLTHSELLGQSHKAKNISRRNCEADLSGTQMSWAALA